MREDFDPQELMHFALDSFGFIARRGEQLTTVEFADRIAKYCTADKALEVVRRLRDTDARIKRTHTGYEIAWMPVAEH